MCMYTSSRAKRKCFHHKIESQMFLFISGCHIGVHPVYTNMASPYKVLQSCMKRLGE